MTCLGEGRTRLARRPPPRYLALMPDILALDVGTRTIGVARADSLARLPTPLLTLSRKGVKKDCARLAELCTRCGVATLVVGLPYELDGGEGRSARLARQVGDALAKLTGLPLHYQDERFSTVEASERLHQAGWNCRQQKSRIDQAAAAVILEAWLATRPDGG
ncbi:MAG: Holliday junction resolvase RuvX [Oligoflexia bacterium]|nr:Holliday junction resolvase RuvX [Oligoflexia bacterium]